MVKLLLTKLWPALIPIVLYILWIMYRRYRQRQLEGEATIGIKDGPLIWMLSASVILLIFGLLYLYIDISDADQSYIPGHYEEGVWVPGKSGK